MASETNKPQNNNNNDFGLPKAEFKPIESGSNTNWLKMTLIIAGIVLIIGIGVIFWIFQRSSSENKNDFMANTLNSQQADEDIEGYTEETTTIGNVPKSGTDSGKTKVEVKDTKEVKPTKKAQESTQAQTGNLGDSDDMALEELDKISDSFVSKPEHKPSSFIEQLRAGDFDHKAEKKDDDEDDPVIMMVTAPKGVYYVVVASHIDMDLAMDYAQKIAQKAKHVKVIVPEKGKYFVRVAVSRTKTIEEANQKVQELKAEYGDNLWVMKY